MLYGANQQTVGVFELNSENRRRSAPNPASGVLGIGTSISGAKRQRADAPSSCCGETGRHRARERRRSCRPSQGGQAAGADAEVKPGPPTPPSRDQRPATTGVPKSTSTTIGISGLRRKGPLSTPVGRNAASSRSEPFRSATSRRQGEPRILRLAAPRRGACPMERSRSIKSQR
jgi:hypothetical protein